MEMKDRKRLTGAQQKKKTTYLGALRKLNLMKEGPWILSWEKLALKSHTLPPTAPSLHEDPSKPAMDSVMVEASQEKPDHPPLPTPSSQPSEVILGPEHFSLSEKDKLVGNPSSQPTDHICPKPSQAAPQTSNDVDSDYFSE